MRSLASALDFLGVRSKVSSDATEVDAATHVILPGVGAFDAAMRAMHERDLYEPLRVAALTRRVPVLGVCLGMQLLFEGSEEGEREGLSILGGRAQRLGRDDAGEFKVPHVGFAAVSGYQATGLFSGLGQQSYFYFTHSYAVSSVSVAANCGECQHAMRFVAGFQRENVCGVQFHPEKSQSTGLHLLSNFFFMGREPR